MMHKTKFKRLMVAAILLTVLVIGVTTVRNAQKNSDVANTRKIKGPKNAPITIVEFSDFQCPSCAKSQVPLKSLLNQFPDSIQLQFHHFPLQMHPMAFDAAKFSECALRQNKFWEFHDWLFGNQETWSKSPDVMTLFFKSAKGLGLNLDQLAVCLSDPQVVSAIERDKQMGTGLQVSSTPTFFINGERLVGTNQLSQNGAVMIQNKLTEITGNKKKR